jgi:hypothetical protein
MRSRLFTRIRRGDAARIKIRSGEQAAPAEPGRITFCEHRPADDTNRGRNCPECGPPMLYVPPAVA